MRIHEVTKTMGLALLASALIALTSLHTPLVSATQTSCTGVLAPGTYDNIVVPTGSSCSLGSGTTVTGNVKVKKAGSLSGSLVTIIGNLKSDKAANIALSDSEVLGNVQIKKSTGSVMITVTTIGGHLKIQKQNSAASSITLEEIEVGGHLNLQNNKALEIIVSDSIIDGNLQCKKNTPPPTDDGSSNSVGGDATGQCTELI